MNSGKQDSSGNERGWQFKGRNEINNQIRHADTDARRYQYGKGKGEWDHFSVE